MKGGMSGLQTGLIAVVVLVVIALLGLNFLGPIITAAVAAAGTVGIGSFAGVAVLIGIIPIAVVVGLVYLAWQHIGKD